MSEQASGRVGREATDDLLGGVHIVIVVQNLPVPFDRRVWQEAQALAGAGAAVSVICPSDRKNPSGDFTLSGIRILRYPAPREARGAAGYLLEYGWALLAIMAGLARISLRRRPTVIHLCNPPDLLFLAALPFRALGAKILFDQHDLGPELIQAKALPLARVWRRLALALEWCTYRVADHVIATNESYRAVAIGRGQRDPEQVTVVRSGPPAEWAKEVEPTRRWHRGRQYLVGYVGVMGRQEGIGYLLEATRILVQEAGLDLQVALVGGGPERDSLQQDAAALGLADVVEFHGRVPDDDLRSILGNADVCVNPDEVNALNDKSTMNKILEYMALGRPVVQFDVTEGRYSAGGASLYAAPNDVRSLADTLRQLLTDPDRAARMGALARERFLDSLCWETQTPQLLAAYASITGRARVASLDASLDAVCGS
jgi:glycosyltransferase involved in cell wall biosynthesis